MNEVPSLRVTPLASGSAGNSTLLEGFLPDREAGSVPVRVLIDQGLVFDDLTARLAKVGVEPAEVDWVLVTHRHKDHVSGVRDLVRRTQCRVLCTPRAAKSLGTEVQHRVRRIRFGTPETCGTGRSLQGLRVTYHRVPHDAPETAAVRVECGDFVYGHLTDAGHVPDDLVGFLQGCDALLLESNHDEDQLHAGSDPPHLKRRITSSEGHLSNAQSAAALRRLCSPRLRQLWLAHLSRRNNTAEKALRAAREATTGHPDLPIMVLEQDRPAETVEIVGPASRLGEEVEDPPECVGVCQADAEGVCLGCGRRGL